MSFSCRRGLKSNQKVIGCLHNIHATITTTYMCYQANSYCSSQDSQLDKTVDDFSLAVVSMVPFGSAEDNKKKISWLEPAWFFHV